MDDLVDPLQGSAQTVHVADVGADELHLGRQAGRAADVPMHLLDQEIQNADFVPLPEKTIGEVAADKSGSTGNQDPIGQVYSNLRRQAPFRRLAVRHPHERTLRTILHLCRWFHYK